MEANNPVPDAPALVAPQNLAQNVQTAIELQWNRSSSANGYVLQVSEDPSFGSLLVEKNLARAYFAVSELELGQTYHWRVKALNDMGESEWSPVWSFAPEKEPVAPPIPALAVPADSTMNHPESIVFSWDPVEGASSYEIHVALEPRYLRKIANRDGIRETSFTVHSLVDTYIYYWRVKAVNPAGESSWSPTRVLAVGFTYDWSPVFPGQNDPIVPSSN